MLELRNITHRWSSASSAPRAKDQTTASQPLLQDLSLQVAAGQTVAILGASGSGKSTLLKIMAGLQVPDQGQVWLDGQNISDWPPERRRLALMFQDFALFAHLSLEDNVAFGLIEQGLRRAAARAQAADMLARFGLAGRGRERIGTLSGGEQQRVALARALITQPKALLLDEPFSALDADLRQDLRQRFARHIEAHHTRAVLVTHDEAEARAMASSAWRLVQGSLLPLW